MTASPPPTVDFSSLKKKKRLPPPPDDASDNLTAPEHAPVPPSTATPATAAEPLDRPVGRVVRPYVPPPPVEAVDGRSRLRTGRTEPFSTRVRSDFRHRLVQLADHLGCTMAEALEIAVERMEREKGLGDDRGL